MIFYVTHQDNLYSSLELGTQEKLQILVCTHYSFACEKQSSFSFVTGPQSTFKTGNTIIVKIVPQALKSCQHEGWDWLGGHL